MEQAGASIEESEARHGHSLLEVEALVAERSRLEAAHAAAAAHASDADACAVQLAEAEAEQARVRESAPGLHEVARRRAGSVDETKRSLEEQGRRLAAELEKADARAATLRHAAVEAEQAVQSASEVRTALQVFQATLDSETILTEDQGARLFRH